MRARTTVAAWKQAFRAESAATAALRTEYAEALLDLIKAFDNVPYWLLVQEGRRLGYPLWLLRLSIATYKMTRVIRIRKVVSQVVRAFKGITAGSGFATTEMRVVIIHLVDKAKALYPAVTPTPLRG